MLFFVLSDTSVMQFRGNSSEMFRIVRVLKYKPLPILSCIRWREDETMTYDIAQQRNEYIQAREAFVNSFNKGYQASIDQQTQTAINTITDINGRPFTRSKSYFILFICCCNNSSYSFSCVFVMILV